jgi:predicted acetyltransferase
VRIVDPATALSGRRYSTDGRVVLKVEDAFCPWVAGTYELEGGPDGASCVPSTASPDITLGATELGAAYLGGGSFEWLARAGRVAGDEAAIRKADAMFQWRPLPWGNEIF